jgi:hypothetical protein
VVHTFNSANVAAETVTWATHGLTTPVLVEIAGAAMIDPAITHMAIGGNDLGGTLPVVANLTGLSQLYVARNGQTGTIPNIAPLVGLQTFWAHENSASGWGSLSVPATLRDLRVYDNGLSQAVVDEIISQCNTAGLGAGAVIDISGSNASPSTSGWNTRDSLISRGASVVVSGTDPRIGPPIDYKWFPGHYHFFDDPANLAQGMSDIASYPIVRGVQTRFLWDELEPTRDVYDFSGIIAAADTLHAAGKKLVVQLQFRNFNVNVKPYPAYLQTAEFDGGIYTDGKGWNLRLWNAAVRTRFNALMSALGTACDAHPAIACMNTSETAAADPTDPTLLANWTTLREQHSEGVIAGVVAMKQQCTHTPVVAYFNGSAAHGVPFGEAADEYAVGLGGPDSYIGAFENNLFLRHSYSLISSKAGAVPILMGVQWNNYIWTGASSAWLYPDPDGVPVGDIFAFDRDVLKANFMCWQKRTPYWTNVLALWASLPTLYPGDDAGGLPSALPTGVQV